MYLFHYKVFHGFYVKPTSTSSLMIYLPKVIILAQAWRLLKYPTSSIVHHCQWLTLFNQSCTYMTSLNAVPNAHVCVYLMVHITKLQLQTTFPKPLYIPHVILLSFWLLLKGRQSCQSTTMLCNECTHTFLYIFGHCVENICWVCSWYWYQNLEGAWC